MTGRCDAVYRRAVDRQTLQRPVTRARLTAIVAAAIALAVAGAGCGDGDTAAVGAAQEATAEGPAATVAAEASTPAIPSFRDEILPVLADSCAGCHAPGAPGSTHLELATAFDARAASPDIALVVDAGVMPPWPASDLSVAFHGDNSLDPDQVDAVVAWARAGAPLDVDDDTPIESTRPLQVIEDPDLVVTSAKGPYRGSVEVRDDYRCLIFDPQVTEPSWILASQFEPDRTEVVHHGIISLASAELRQQAEYWDSLEPGPGWTCYGGNGLSTAEGGYEIGLGGWAPGAQPARRPPGYATPLNPGDFIVVQIHYHYDDDDIPADLSRMVFDLASPAEIEANGGSFAQLTSQLYLGAAEIPCTEGDTHPLCDRDAALDRVEDLYGPFGRSLAEALTRQCGYAPEDFVDMNQGEAWSSCDLAVGNPGRIVSIGAHMHELGQSLRMTLHPDTPDEVVLLDIPDWSFEWQFGYSPVDDIVIERGDIVRVECRWGRDRAPYEAVGYILWAEGTGDEMCYTSITTAPGER